MNKKLLTRFLCALLTVLTLVSVIPVITIPAAAEEEATTVVDYTKVEYKSVEERLKSMRKYFENDRYALYVDEVKDHKTITSLGIVAYQDKVTGETLFTNPWDMSLEGTC